MKQTEQDKIWESYIHNEDTPRGMPAGNIKADRLHTDKKAGKIGQLHEPETKVLEGVRCDCKDCIHWVVGDLCKAESISISKGWKLPGETPECVTYKSKADR